MAEDGDPMRRTVIATRRATIIRMVPIDME
jgi:hypothetical protein